MFPFCFPCVFTHTVLPIGLCLFIEVKLTRLSNRAWFSIYKLFRKFSIHELLCVGASAVLRLIKFDIIIHKNGIRHAVAHRWFILIDMQCAHGNASNGSFAVYYVPFHCYDIVLTGSKVAILVPDIFARIKWNFTVATWLISYLVLYKNKYSM